MSSSKTANLQLNQWAATDSFLREEFNQDNGKIDAAIQRVAENPVVGVYTGDGRQNREINLGFRPRFVHLVCIQGTYISVITIFAAATIRLSTGSSANLTASIYPTAQGFWLKEYAEANASGQTCHYIAFH
ncbi:MAG: hypothetical protein RR051_07705 [Clostridiales bacterium]